MFEQIPWWKRLPKGNKIEHPDSLDALKDWPKLNDAAKSHLNFLLQCDDYLQQFWLPPWKEMFAVGPFIWRKRTHSTIPFVIVAKYHRPYRHIVYLARALSIPYSQFGILPEIYLLSPERIKLFDKYQEAQWNLTQKVSVRLGRSK
jgi:hypothetical protein